MASQDIVSNSTDFEENSVDESGEPENGNFRIRNVDEINSTVQVNGESTEKGKRRLPNWLASPVEEIKEKRPRVSRRIPNGEGPSTGNEASASASASAVLDSVDSCTPSKLNDNNLVSSNSASTTETSARAARAIKVERDEINANEDAEAVSTNAENMDTNEACASSSANDQVDVKPVKVEVKNEVSDEPASSSVADSNTNTRTDGAPASSVASSNTNTTTDVVKQEATSSIRDSCKFGIRCYRRNPAHRNEVAHPGDSDYRRPNYPSPPKGTPECPFGDRCYRRNPVHFQEYSHPPSTDFKKNWQQRQKRLRKQKKDPAFEYYNDDDEDEEEEPESEEDPFASDGSSDEYIPSDDE